MRLAPYCALRGNSRILVALCALTPLLLGGEAISATPVSNVRAGEALVLFPAAARQSEDGREWIVPLHAWVYAPQSSTRRRAIIVAGLRLKHGLRVTPASAPYFDPRVNHLLADNKRGRSVVVEVAGARATLPPTAANGHTRGEVRIPVTAATPDGAMVPVRAVLPPSQPRTIETRAHLIGPAGVSVISDIDDTVKVTHVLDRSKLWESTFLQPFEAVGGMPDAYRRLAAAGAPIHYVSSSPWLLSEPLVAFLAASGLPLASISLKDFRYRDGTFFNIFRPGRETKPPQIAAILGAFPRRRFILIGDSGEDDPEVYADVLRSRPSQVARIYIRNITGATREDARFSKAFAGLEHARWELFDSPSRIVLP
jgi:hypothetical protein